MEGWWEARKQAEELLLEWFPFCRWEDAVTQRDALQSGLQPVIHGDAWWSRIHGRGGSKVLGC